MPATSFSGTVFEATWNVVHRAMLDRRRDVLKTIDNNFSFEAPLAYVLAVTTLEAYINEFFVMNWFSCAKSCELSVEELQDKKLEEKYIIGPHLFGCTTFSKGTQPFQDFRILVRIRNELVHYRMRDYTQGKHPRYAERLKAANAVLNVGDSTHGLWLHKLSSFRGAFWAAKTMQRMLSSFRGFLAEPVKAKRVFRPLEHVEPDGIEDAYAVLCKEYPSTHLART